MTPRPTVSLAEKLKKIRISIERYQCDDAERTVLARIVDCKIALRALSEMQLTDAQLERVIFSCIDAANVSQKFNLILAREVTMPGHLEKMERAVTDLRQFLNEISAPPEDSLSAWISIDAEDKSRCLHALYEIERLIKNRHQIAKETPARIGATRKRSIKNAQENAGIGWLAASIKQIAGRPYGQQTCRLAEALFSVSEISKDRLRRALRNSTERDWRIQ